MAKFDVMVFDDGYILAVSTKYTIEEAKRIAREWLGAPRDGNMHETAEGWVRWEFYENDGEYSTEPGFANYRLHFERVKNSHPVYTFREVEI